MACVVSAHNSRIEALAFDIHHRRLASTGDGGVKVWQMDTGGKIVLIYVVLSTQFL